MLQTTRLQLRPLQPGDETILHPLHADPEAEADQVARLHAWRAARDDAAVNAALEELRRVAKSGANIMPASIACARAGVTTGEWSEVLREVFGEYREPPIYW